jgi:hypothetical protein
MGPGCTVCHYDPDREPSEKKDGRRIGEFALTVLMV